MGISSHPVNGIIKNCISIDVEGFVESNLQSFPISKKYIDKVRENYEIEKNTVLLLKLLSELDIKATFFFLGRIGKDIPNLVREVAQYGHEIACHGYEHIRIVGESRDEFKKKLLSAKNCLEDVSGTRVYGFRAPEFSITESTKWALDILKEVGFLYDSSIYPTGIHDVYGIRDAKSFIHKLPNDLIEFPLPVIKLFKIRFPFGGGGYFRIYPLILTKIFIWKLNKLGCPCMLYMHPYEVGPIIPFVSGLSYFRKFRHYFRCKNGKKRLKEILRAFSFDTAIEILKEKSFLQ